MNTDCLKCNTPMKMPDLKRSASVSGSIYRARIIITEYICHICKHHNDLKRRKGWKEYYAEKQVNKEERP
jgi:hypothetical protein